VYFATLCYAPFHISPVFGMILGLKALYFKEKGAIIPTFEVKTICVVD